ncbi:MAG: DHHW family protein [Romboutsia timonensis]|uniref:DHHW family protein n=1 Tax=Romboutsia timonensis TaxID=1776391 RepID=UPI002A74CA7A|nr:DHHW family protein [Romboutsia timonensis]MDY2882825.1 DHHW family protein [Romboutsia timonensis]
MKFKYLSSIGTITLIFVISIMSIISKDYETSDLEGRKLEVMPTMENLILKEKTHNFNAYLYELLFGDIFEKWDNYFSDHIYFRDNFVNAYTSIQKQTNKKYVNSVYLGKDNYFLSDTNSKEISDNQLKARARYFTSISEMFKESQIYMINLPYKNDVYESKMPIDGYRSLNNIYINKLFEYIENSKLTCIDVKNDFKDNEELYHKTDHHWNMNGTWIAYENIVNKIKNDFEEIGEIKTKDFYNIDIYENYFIGTDGRKVGQIVSEMDDIEIYNHKNKEDYNVYIDGELSDFYWYDFLNEERFNNDYGVYLGGDHAEVIIENVKSNNDLSIVIIGDSMDNPLIPLLAPHFNKIYSYDLRYYNESIIDKIQSINPEIIAFIGLTNNFINDEGSLFNIY